MRSREREYLDDHEPEQEVVDRVYRFLALVNRHVGGTRATLGRFERLSQTWRPGARITVLDVASGMADVPRALIAWGCERGFDIRVTALDLSTRALNSARRAAPADVHLQFVCGEVGRLPYADGAYDYVTCALFFHHLADEEIVAALKAFDRIAARGIVVNDLVRTRRAYFWIRLFTLPCHPILRNDGPLSVRRALRPNELATLAATTGLPWLSVERHFGHRMTLAGEKID
ncbi:MAG: methyltransferase domain-containing protein [Vicinamibacterales bacterium]